MAQHNDAVIARMMASGHVLVHRDYDRRITARQCAERWVRDHWQSQREIESWTDNRFSLVYGVSVYEIVDVAGGWHIFRHA